MFDNKTPFDGMHLQWFAGGPSDDEGQGDLPIEGQESTLGSPEEEVSTFYEWTDPEGGETHKFSSPDELGEFIKGSYLRHSDYTRKTQDLAKQRDEFGVLKSQYENDRKSFYDQKSEWEKKIEQYKQYDNFLKQNPHIMQELKKRVGELSEDTLEAKMKDFFEKNYGSKFKEIEEQKRLEENKRQYEEAVKVMSEKHKNFNQKAVQEAYEALRAGDLHTLMEVLHYSVLGKKTPLEVEQELIENQAKKKEAGLITSQGNNGTAPKSSAKTLDEARMNALRDVGAI